MRGVKSGLKVFLLTLLAMPASAENPVQSHALLTAGGSKRVRDLEVRFLSALPQASSSGKDVSGTSYAVYEYFSDGAHVKLPPNDSDAGLKWAQANPEKSICRLTAHASKGAALPALSGKTVVNLLLAKTVRESKAERKVILDNSHDPVSGMAELGLHFRYGSGRVGLVCFRAGKRRMVLGDLSVALRDRVALREAVKVGASGGVADGQGTIQVAPAF